MGHLKILALEHISTKSPSLGMGFISGFSELDAH